MYRFFILQPWCLNVSCNYLKEVKEDRRDSIDSWLISCVIIFLVLLNKLRITTKTIVLVTRSSSTTWWRWSIRKAFTKTTLFWSTQITFKNKKSYFVNVFIILFLHPYKKKKDKRTYNKKSLSLEYSNSIRVGRELDRRTWLKGKL